MTFPFHNNAASFWDWASALDGASGPSFGIDYAQPRGDGFFARFDPAQHARANRPQRGPATPEASRSTESQGSTEEGESSQAGAKAAAAQQEASTPQTAAEGKSSSENSGCHRGRHGGCSGRRSRGPFAVPWTTFAHSSCGAPGGIDPSGLFTIISDIAQAVDNEATKARDSANSATGSDSKGSSFSPPIDLFSTETAYILHVALPGAKKDDVGVHWDAEKGQLNVAGVVHRPGDEEFLKTLKQEERRIGVFDRSVKLPPRGEKKEEIDAEDITAKMENGILVITVPKVEKEWVELKRVDIE